MPYNYGPPAVDFSPLAKLGETFFNAYDRGVKRRQDEEAPKLLSQLYDASTGSLGAGPQGMSLSSLGQGAAASYNQQGKDPTFVAMSGTQPSASITGDKEAFTRAIMPFALEASQKTGVDPRIIVAQAALESAWGTKAPGNNFFGIKSHGQDGGQTLATTEVVNGQPVKVNDSFRTYGGMGESVRGYADFINQNPRYAGLKNARGLEEQIAALQASGYATDPNYGKKIASIANGLPAADLPAPGARETQFQIPGQTGLPAAQAAPVAQPISREMFSALAANPNTRAIAGQILTSRMNPQSQFDFQVVGDQLVRVNKRTGAAEPVPGITKQQTTTVGPGQTVVDQNGRVIFQAPASEKDRYELVKGKSGSATGIYDKIEGRLLPQEEAQRRGIQAGAGEQQEPLDFKDITSVRKEIQSLPSYKSYTSAIPAYTSMVDAAKRDTKAADLNLVYGLAKIMDPTSVVREGEMIMVNNTQGLTDQVVGMINSVNGGARLSPEARAHVLREAESRMNGFKQSFDSDIQTYRDMAGRWKIKEADIIPNVPGLPQGQPKQRIAPPSGAIEYLRKNPALRQQFDEKYGPGASAEALGIPNG